MVDPKPGTPYPFDVAEKAGPRGNKRRMPLDQAGIGKARIQSLSSGIVEQVLDALFQRKLVPGQFLGTEAQLCEAFQTSRVPIREALGRLAALGVVKIKTGARGGATIASTDPEQFAIALAVQFMLAGVDPGELFDFRIAIECRAVQLAAENATDEEIADLRARFAQIPTGRASRNRIEKILAFHAAIVDLSRAHSLIAFMHALEHALTMLYVSRPDTVPPVPKSYEALGTILECIAARDPDGARAAMEAHLLRQRKAIILKGDSPRVFGANRLPLSVNDP